MLILVSVFIACSGDCYTSYSYPTVVCPSLSLTNGMVSYSDPPQGVGSVATHSCDPGYILIGGSTKICQLSTSYWQQWGWWNGTTPTCVGRLQYLHYIDI